LERPKELRPYPGELETTKRRSGGGALNCIVGLANAAKSGETGEAHMSDRFLDVSVTTGDMPAGASFG
jgi:hypothetical protein